MVVRQYPYQLWVLQTPEAVQSPQGHWVGTVVGSWVEAGPCRDEANGGGSTINLEDGTAYRYDSLIQLPKSSPLVYAGTQIQVRDGDTVRLTATVSRSVSSQLHKRLWV